MKRTHLALLIYISLACQLLGGEDLHPDHHVQMKPGTSLIVEVNPTFRLAIAAMTNENSFVVAYSLDRDVLSFSVSSNLLEMDVSSYSNNKTKLSYAANTETSQCYTTYNSDLIPVSRVKIGSNQPVTIERIQIHTEVIREDSK